MAKKVEMNGLTDCCKNKNVKWGYKQSRWSVYKSKGWHYRYIELEKKINKLSNETKILLKD